MISDSSWLMSLWTAQARAGREQSKRQGLVSGPGLLYAVWARALARIEQ